jgi:hypothetical protein
MDAGGSFSGSNEVERETDYSQQSNAQAKNMWIHTSTPHLPSWPLEKQGQIYHHFYLIKIIILISFRL